MPTSIKVSEQLRDRINRDARERGVTASGLIEQLLDAEERRQRVEAFGQSLRSADPGYWDEFGAWDRGADGPRDDD